MTDTTTNICIAPLTPTYSTLPRLNTTALLLFVILSPTTSWATKGALAALMVRAGTIAINAIVMLATRSTSDTFQLDCIASWFILSEIAAAGPLLLFLAPALKRSKARSLIRIWNVVIYVGAICGYTMLRWAEVHVDGSSCENNFGSDRMTRPRTAVFTQLERGQTLQAFDVAAVAAASSGLLLSVIPSDSQNSPNTTWSLFGSLRHVLLLFCSVIFVAIVVLHERYLFRSPMLLPVTSYEQWSCWAAAGLILLATGLNQMLGHDPVSQTTVHIGGPTDVSDPTLEAPSMQLALGPTGRKPGRQADLEWSGVVGMPTPAHVA